jgi:hypothetical protein
LLARPPLQHRLEHRRLRVQMHDPARQHQMRRAGQIRRSTHSHLRYIRCNIVEDMSIECKSRRQIRFHVSNRRLGSPSDLRLQSVAAMAECCIKRNSARFSLSLIPDRKAMMV